MGLSKEDGGSGSVFEGGWYPSAHSVHWYEKLITSLYLWKRYMRGYRSQNEVMHNIKKSISSEWKVNGPG